MRLVASSEVKKFRPNQLIGSCHVTCRPEFTFAHCKTMLALFRAYHFACKNKMQPSIFCFLSLFLPGVVFGQVPSGSIIWLRSDSGVVSSKGRVTQWRDLSGNGNNAMMSDTAHQ